MKLPSLLRSMGRYLLAAALGLGATQPFTVHGQFAGTFVHPGGLHALADYQRMSNKVAQAASPWIDSYHQLMGIAEAQTNWGWAPAGQIFRCGSGCNNNFARSQKDALAIYYNALRYWITGDANFANHAIQGMDAWSSTMTNGVGGDSNWALGAGTCGYEFAVAGEALRGYSGWSQASINNYKNFLILFEQGNHSFLTGHNGTCDSHYWCNWDACNLASMIACGVFCDDTNIFNEAVTYMESGIGSGNLTSAAWYIHPDGLAQWEESGRDQAHTMDGITWLGVALQVAWNQGLDLYGYDNNRYLRGLEYSAKYNLFNSVPYVLFHVCDSADDFGTVALSSGSRGFLPPTWDLLFNHYVNVKGLSAPYTAQAAAQLRPDGFYNNANSPDFVGFTTLTSYLDPIAAGAVPGGLVASASAHTANLTWFGSTYATSYNVKRSTTSGGPYTTIATVGTSSTHYIDAGLTSGTTYYYVVSADSPGGESANSSEVAASIGPVLVAQLKFDESTGTTAYDSTGDGWNGTLIGGPTWVAGQYGNAVSLSGSSQYVALPPGVVAGVQDFTISAWVYLNTINTWARLFDFGADTDRYMFLAPYSGSGTLRFAITKFSGHGEEQINGPALAAGAWHHVAVTLQGTDGAGVGILYVDGTPVGTNNAMSYYPDMIGSLINDNNNYIGRSAFSGDPYLNGKVDDFRIYSGALSAAAISAVMANNPLPAPTATPAAPSAPTGLTAAAVSSSQINLSWTASGGATSYNIWRATTSAGPYVLVNNTTSLSNSLATSYSDTGLTDGTTYYYMVCALNDGGQSASSAQASATPPVPALVDYWKFDETSGTTAFDSSGANNATLAAGATWSSAGKINGCVALNGASTSYATFPAGFVSALNDFSITAWVYVKANASWARLFDFGAGATNYMFLAPASGGNSVRYAINIGAGEQQINSSAILPAGGWHHIAVTLSGNIGILYLDGVQAGVNAGMTLKPSSLGSTTLNYLGRSQFSSDPYLNGSVDDFRIYNGALSASEVSALAGGLTQPPAPAGLSAVGGNLVVNLNWTQSTGSGITGNNVYRSTSGSGGPYNLLASLAVSTAYSDTAVSAGNTYYYSVTAVNSGGESAMSAYAGTITIPAAPAGLTATGGNNQVALSWTASAGATSYNVKRSTTSGGPYTTVASPTGTSYTDTGLANGTTYYYVVSAVNAGGASGNSTQASATPIAPPAAPTGLTPTPGNAQVSLSWTVSTGATGYNVKRSTTSGGPYTTVASPSGTSYTDTGLTNGTTYYYVVSAVNGSGESTNSTQVSATPIAAPPAPTGLAATGGNAQAVLSWSASSGATSYNVKRSTTSGGPYTTVASPTGTSYTDTGLASGTTYYYVVSAVNGSGESANSAQSSALTIAAAPTGLTATAGNAQVGLSWSASTGAASYNVKRATVNGGPYTAIATGVTSLTYTDTGLTNGTTYYYVVSAVNSSGESANSGQVSAAPTGTLLAYLKFDETSGTTASDSTGHGWNGALVNGATWVAGHSNNAVNLNGTNQYVSLPAGVISTLSKCTIAAWVNLSTVSTWNRIFDFGSNTTTYMFLTPKSGSGAARFAITTSGSTHEQQINGTAALPAGGWHHVAVTLAGSVGVLYVDHVPVGTNSSMTINPSSLGSSTQNWIGRSQFGGDPYLKGKVDEFRIYSTALTASQISALP